MAAPKLELHRDIPLHLPVEIRGVTVETVRVHRPTLGQLKAVMADPEGAMAFVKDQTGRVLSSTDFDELLAEDAEIIDGAIQDFLPPRWRREPVEQPSLSQPSSPQNSPA